MNKRLVLDTNIWVSYFIGARFTEITDLILENDLTVLTSMELNEREQPAEQKRERKL